MRGGRQKQGYTIVEVMIFLVISGFMFIIAVGFVSGKQANTEFKQGMNSINSNVQQVLSDVGNGFYPSTGNLTCISNAAGGQPQITAVSSTLGSNQGCVFLGKIIQFDADNNPSSYNIFSVVSRQNVGDTTTPAPSSFVDAQPRTITGAVDLTANETIDWSLRVTGMYDGAASPANAIGAVGFFGSFNQSAGQGGSQTVTAVAIPGSATGQSTANMIGIINGGGEAALLDSKATSEPNPTITICMTGGIGRFGSLVIGGASGQRLSTEIHIGGTAAGVGC